MHDLVTHNEKGEMEWKDFSLVERYENRNHTFRYQDRLEVRDDVFALLESIGFEMTDGILHIGESEEEGYLGRVEAFYERDHILVLRNRHGLILVDHLDRLFVLIRRLWYERQFPKV